MTDILVAWKENYDLTQLSQKVSKVTRSFDGVTRPPRSFIFNNMSQFATRESSVSREEHVKQLSDCIALLTTNPAI
jgi:hypothetical protein